MLNLVEASGVVTIGYPRWLGPLLILCGVALAIYLARHPALTRRTFGIAMAALVFVFGGGYFAAYKVTLSPEEARVYAPLREDARIAWKDVARARVEQRSRGRGGPSNYAVLYGSGGEEVAILLSGLGLDDQSRVVEVLRERLPGRHLD